jgi:phenylalanyl-tRNA synthetase alpha chain
MKSLGKLSPEARGPLGKRLNEAKQAIEALVNARQQSIDQAALDARLSQEAIDVTLPGRGAAPQSRGETHKATAQRFRRVVLRQNARLGFEVRRVCGRMRGVGLRKRAV